MLPTNITYKHQMTTLQHGYNIIQFLTRELSAKIWDLFWTSCRSAMYKSIIVVSKTESYNIFRTAILNRWLLYLYRLAATSSNLQGFMKVPVSCFWLVSENTVNSHITMENDHFANGKTHYFDRAMFNSYVSHYQRVSARKSVFTIKSDWCRADFPIIQC